MHKNHVLSAVLHVMRAGKWFARAHAKFVTVIAAGEGRGFVPKRASPLTVMFGGFLKKIMNKGLVAEVARCQQPTGPGVGPTDVSHVTSDCPYFLCLGIKIMILEKKGRALRIPGGGGTARGDTG